MDNSKGKGMTYTERVTLYAAVWALLGREPTGLEWTRFVEVHAFGGLFPEPQHDLEVRLAQWRTQVQARYPDLVTGNAR